MATVSVIISLYNKGKYIARALNSVFSQIFQDFEVVVVDDGSTDNGPDIVRKYRDARLRLICQTNAGPGAARNLGIKESRGQYIASLDADDEWLPNFLEVSLKNLQEHPDCVLSVAGHLRGKDKTTWEGTNQLKIIPGPWQPPVDMDPHLLGLAVGYHVTGAVLCRRDVLLRFGGFYENRCAFGEDAYLWLQVLLNYQIYRDPTPLMWYHTEASELRDNEHKGCKSLRPILTDPEPIRRNCPEQYRALLGRFLAYCALKTAHMDLLPDNVFNTHYLLKKFPLMREWRWEYTKLKFKVTFPELIPSFRWLKAKAKKTVQSHD